MVYSMAVPARVSRHHDSPPDLRSPNTRLLALEAMDLWISAGYEMNGEDPGCYEVLKRLTVNGKIAGSMIHDARVAALCVHQGVRELWTGNRDFSRFGSLRPPNPFAPRSVD